RWSSSCSPRRRRPPPSPYDRRTPSRGRLSPTLNPPAGRRHRTTADLVEPRRVSAAEMERKQQSGRRSGRRESNPHDQLGRLVTDSGRPIQFAAVIRRYGTSNLRCALFWVEIWVENRRCPESVNIGAA